MTDHAKKLTELLGEWPEGSPQHAALIAAIADVERLYLGVARCG